MKKFSISSTTRDFGINSRKKSENTSSKEGLSKERVSKERLSIIFKKQDGTPRTIPASSNKKIINCKQTTKKTEYRSNKKSPPSSEK